MFEEKYEKLSMAEQEAFKRIVNWMLAHEDTMLGAALEDTRKHLRRVRRMAHDWEETAWRWKAIATTAIAVLAVVVFGIIIL